MPVMFTKVSFPHGYADMAEYLRKEFAPLPAGQSVEVVALPKGARFDTMEGGRQTILTDDNFESAAREVEANYRQFDSQAAPGERLYIVYRRI
jgi:hypothetical protein